MKKAIYLLAAVAMMVSCDQEQVLVDNPAEGTADVPITIGFDTFVDKATRAQGTNSTELNDYYPAFNVYGWKTVDGVTSDVFDNVTVSYFNPDKGEGVKPGSEWGEEVETGWYYKYIRYWDKMASKYQFSAYAPTTASDVIECNADGLITIGTETDFVIVESTNLMKTPAKELAFTGFKYDYMTAQSNQKSIDAVTLNFKHLQAKLNVRIKLSSAITTAQDVSVQKIEIHNLCDKGYYTNVEGIGVSGWRVPNVTDFIDTYVPTADNVYSLNNARENFNGYYVLEQLIIPQTIAKYEAPEYIEKKYSIKEEIENEKNENTNDEPVVRDPDEPESIPVSLDEYTQACVYVEYTIGAETFKSYSPLANIFNRENGVTSYDFKGGMQYTLNVIVGPSPIKFKAEVAEWAEAVEKDLVKD